MQNGIVTPIYYNNGKYVDSCFQQGNNYRQLQNIKGFANKLVDFHLRNIFFNETTLTGELLKGLVSIFRLHALLFVFIESQIWFAQFNQ